MIASLKNKYKQILNSSTLMSNKNKCRICLSEGAKYLIFEENNTSNGIHSKLLQCFHEKIEPVEGYPDKICESCNTTLDTVYTFVTRYKTSSRLLASGLTVVKKEKHENSHNQNDTKCYEMEFIKNEPFSDSDGLEPLEDWEPVPQKPKKKLSTSEVEAKLKNLKCINIVKRPVKKRNGKTKRVTGTLLEADFDWNGENCLKTSKSEKYKEAKLKQQKTKIKSTSLPKYHLDKPKNQSLEVRKYLCDLCGEVFPKSIKLNHHKSSKHSNVECKCPHCPSIFTCERNRTAHIKRKHEEKTFICETCRKAFGSKKVMREHIKIVHLKLKRKPKRVPCSKCDKTFCNIKSLTVHDRSAHTGLRPAQCKECGASFFHEEYLKQHMLLHTGELPHKCPICSRGYAQLGNMKSHMKHNHKLSDLEPELIKTLEPRWFKHLKAP